MDRGRVTSGGGPAGSVVIADVERVAGETAPASAAAAQTGRGRQMRQTIAAVMSRSKREIPHYYLAETIPLRKATEWLQAENAKRPMEKRLLMTVLFIKAVAVALAQFPELNGYYREGVFESRGTVHVGIAIFLRDGGLVAPAIHETAGKSLDEIMATLGDLIQRARSGSLRSSELSDPTITITSLGDLGVEAVHGVIYPQIRENVVKNLIMIAPELDPVALKPDKLLREQVDLDSFDWLRFLLAIHEQLNVEIPEADYHKLTTLDQLVSYLDAKLSGRSP